MSSQNNSPATSPKTKVAKKKSKGFSSYTARLIVADNKAGSKTNEAHIQLTSLADVLAENIARQAWDISIGNKTVTVSESSIDSAVKLLFPTKLATASILAADKSMKRFKTSMDKKDDEEGKSKSKSFRAGLIIPSSVCRRILKGFGSRYNFRGFSSIRVGAGASIRLAAVLEEVLSLVIHLSQEEVKQTTKVRLTQRFLFLAVSGDKELTELFNTFKIKILDGGVSSFIHSEFTKKLPAKKSTGTKAPGTKHRFRAGTVALRNIRNQQKETKELLAKAPFDRVIRTIGATISPDLKFGKDALVLIKKATEMASITLLEKASDLIVHGKRNQVMNSDVELAWKISNYGVEFDTMDNFSDIIRISDDKPASEIGKGGIARMMSRAGIKMKANSSYDSVRHYMFTFIEKVLKGAVVFRDSAGKKTVNVKEVSSSLSVCGMNYI